MNESSNFMNTNIDQIEPVPMSAWPSMFGGGPGGPGPSPGPGPGGASSFPSSPMMSEIEAAMALAAFDDGYGGGMGSRCKKRKERLESALVFHDSISIAEAGRTFESAAAYALEPITDVSAGGRTAAAAASSSHAGMGKYALAMSGFAAAARPPPSSRGARLPAAAATVVAAPVTPTTPAPKKLRISAGSSRARAIRAKASYSFRGNDTGVLPLRPLPTATTTRTTTTGPRLPAAVTPVAGKKPAVAAAGRAPPLSRAPEEAPPLGRSGVVVGGGKKKKKGPPGGGKEGPPPSSGGGRDDDEPTDGGPPAAKDDEAARRRGRPPAAAAQKSRGGGIDGVRRLISTPGGCFSLGAAVVGCRSNSKKKSSSDKHSGGRARTVIPFPVKLHDMLTELQEMDEKKRGDSGCCNGSGRRKKHQKLQSIVSWMPHGRAVKVHEPEEFVRKILPKYFRQTKLTSFQRQLNVYGFTRIVHGNDRGAYYNSHFLRGKRDLAFRIARESIKGTGVRTTTLIFPEQEPNFYAMGPAELEGDDAPGSKEQPLHRACIKTVAPAARQLPPRRPPLVKSLAEPRPAAPEEAPLAPFNNPADASRKQAWPTFDRADVSPPTPVRSFSSSSETADGTAAGATTTASDMLSRLPPPPLTSSRREAPRLTRMPSGTSLTAAPAESSSCTVHISGRDRAARGDDAAAARLGHADAAATGVVPCCRRRSSRRISEDGGLIPMSAEEQEDDDGASPVRIGGSNECEHGGDEAPRSKQEDEHDAAGIDDDDEHETGDRVQFEGMYFRYLHHVDAVASVMEMVQTGGPMVRSISNDEISSASSSSQQQQEPQGKQEAQGGQADAEEKQNPKEAVRKAEEESQEKEKQEAEELFPFLPRLREGKTDAVLARMLGGLSEATRCVSQVNLQANGEGGDDEDEEEQDERRQDDEEEDDQDERSCGPSI